MNETPPLHISDCRKHGPSYFNECPICEHEAKTAAAPTLPQAGWIALQERPPTRADADENGELLWSDGMGRWFGKWDRSKSSDLWYLVGVPPLPQLPKLSEDEKAFEASRWLDALMAERADALANHGKAVATRDVKELHNWNQRYIALENLRLRVVKENK